MAALFRLRWRLAHLICPELGVEARLKSGLFDVEASQKLHDRAFEVAKASAPKEPFLPADQMAGLLAALRHSRFERAKKVLMVIQDVEQRGMAEEADLLLDRAAQELSVLLFGEV